MTDEEITKRFEVLESRVTGVEIALNEVVLYAHDLGGDRVFSKDDLADRLKLTADRMLKIYAEFDPSVAQHIAFPIQRLVSALRLAGPINDAGESVSERSE